MGLVEWEDVGGHDYTGLFEGGSEMGLIRMSEANFGLLDEAPGLTPSIAIKFTRDGMQSVNHLANVSFGPTNSFNFFANDFKSKIPLFEHEMDQQTVQRKFTEISSIFNYDTLGQVGTSEFAKYKTDGTAIAPHKMPWHTWFVPNPDIRAMWPETREYDDTGREIPFYEQLTQIPEGMTLFEVWGRDVPADPGAERIWPVSNVQHIGNIISKSPIVTSFFGDTRLFFEHEFMQ